MDTHTDNVKTVYPPQTKFAGGIITTISGPSSLNDHGLVAFFPVDPDQYSMFCCALLYVHSRFAIILMGKRELFALLCLPFWCLVIV